MQHHFDTSIAKEYGVNVAIFVDSMTFWTRTNAANNHNFHEDRYWSYGTPEFFANYFPYWKPRLIKDIIKKCRDEGLLLKNNFNKQGYDRTSWYSLSDKALTELNLDITCLKPAETLIGRKSSNGLDVKRTMDETKNVRPIPDTKAVTKPDTKKPKTLVDSTNTMSSTKPSSYKKDENFMRFYSCYPRKEKPADAWKAFKALKPNEELLSTIIQDVNLRVLQHTQWSDPKYIPLPATYIRSAAYEGEIFNEEIQRQNKKKLMEEQTKKNLEAQNEAAKRKADKEQRDHENKYNDALINKHITQCVQDGRKAPPKELLDFARRLKTAKP